MKNRESSMKASCNGERGTKLNYIAPVLTSFGMVRNLTATGSGVNVENAGFDEKNNKKRMP
jgi:hypothetical protein